MLSSNYRVSKKECIFMIFGAQKNCLGPEIFFTKIDLYRGNLMQQSIGAFSKRENISLTLIQGMELVY